MNWTSGLSVPMRASVAVLWRALFLVTLGTVASAQSADPQVAQPVWELGVGVVGRYDSDFPGASDFGAGGAPIPLVRYRGELIDIGGQDALRVIPIETDRIALGFSLDTARRVTNRLTSFGNLLPDLDRLVEFGPELSFRFADDPVLFGATIPGRLDLLLASRGVFSVDGFNVSYEGTIWRPAVRYRVYDVVRAGSRLEASIGPQFATEGVQDFYYQTEPGADGTPGYDASSGYLGTNIRAAIRLPVADRVQMIVGGGATWLGGAANLDSPVVETEWDAILFVRITVALFRSKNTTLRDR